MAERLLGTRCPAVKDGTVVWCEGDCFTLHLKMKLVFAGEQLADHTGYHYEAKFYDRGGRLVATFLGEGGAGKIFAVVFDSETTKRFTKGKYHFDVCLICPGGRRITLANDVPALVK